MPKTGAGLAAFCEQAYAAGMGYVYGAYGQVCTPALRAYYARQYPSPDLAGPPMEGIAAKWDGKRVADCSGLISYYVAVNAFGQNPSKRYFIHYTNSTQIAPISSLPEKPGTLLWKPGHVGVYMGNNTTIEAMGTAYGVVKTQPMSNKWVKWYWPQQIDYSGNQTFIQNPELNPQNMIYIGSGGTASGMGSGARGRGFTTGVGSSVRAVYELILQAMQNLTNVPFNAMNSALEGSIGSVSSSNGNVNPDPGEGHISGSTNQMMARFNSLLASANALESNIKSYAAVIAELSQRVNDA